MFGLVYYKHVPDANIGKLDNISIIMLLVGCHGTCAYKLYCPVTNKVEFIRDFIVKESQVWDWNKFQFNTGAMLTPKLTYIDISYFEGEFSFEGDFESEDESESEGDTNAEVGSNFEGKYDDFDSDNESDSNGDQTSEDDPNSGGNPTSKDRPSEDGDSKVLVSKGGASEVVASEGGLLLKLGH